jgi:hypothetical protein
VGEIILIMQLNKVLMHFTRNMNNKNLAILAGTVVAAVLLGASITGTNTVFASGYEKNQATSQANACGSGDLPLNVLCDNVGSQVQGDENVVAIIGFQEGGND